MLRIANRSRSALVLAVATLVFAGTANAVDPDERLSDPALEARARAISVELRCLVCQNQSIDDSNAPLARDLRLLVRERLTAGNSDAQVMRYVVERYGEFVLLRPPFGLHTAILWLGPLALLAGVAVMLSKSARRRSAANELSPPLTPDEQRRIDALLAPKTPEA
jgi:cytochrome c-type biogenesis protein CcmH